MDRRKCGNCVFWLNDDNFPRLEKRVIVEGGKEIQVRQCIWRAHPSVIMDYGGSPVFTDAKYSCEEFTTEDKS